MTIITTSRTRISLITIEDAKAIREFHLANAHHLSRWGQKGQGSEAIDWKRTTARWAEQIEQGKALRYVARPADESAIIAMCSFYNIIRGVFLSCRIGFALDNSWEGKNLMYEIASALIPVVFAEHGLHRIEAIHHVDNDRSKKLLTRLGFNQEGILKGYMRIDEQWQDHVLCARIKDK